MLKLKNISKLLLTGALTLSFSSVAMAEIYPQAVDRALMDQSINSQWPYATQCIGTDVNVRTEPNTNCEVITMLQPNEKFYVIKVVPKNDYTWMEGITEQGKHGYMVSKYLDAVPNAAARRERFKAALAVSKQYTPSAIAEACGTIFTNKFEIVKPELFPYSPHKVKIGPCWVHGESLPTGFDVIGVLVEEPGYKFLGLQVGDTFTKEMATTMNKDMMYQGWEDCGDISKLTEYCWYRTEAVDGSERPVEGVFIITKNNKITQIRWNHFPID